MLSLSHMHVHTHIMYGSAGPRLTWGGLLKALTLPLCTSQEWRSGEDPSLRGRGDSSTQGCSSSTFLLVKGNSGWGGGGEEGAIIPMLDVWPLWFLVWLWHTVGRVLNARFFWLWIASFYTKCNQKNCRKKNTQWIIVHVTTPFCSSVCSRSQTCMRSRSHTCLIYLHASTYCCRLLRMSFLQFFKLFK